MTIQTAEFVASFKAYEIGTNKISGQIFAPSISKSSQFTNGVLANQADLVWADERTIAASGNDDLDLAGVLASAFGQTLTAVKIVGIMIAADATNGAALNVGGGTNPWITMWIATGDGVKVFPGGAFMNFAPDLAGLGTVTAATADILRISNTNAGATAKYKIAILARSA